MEVDIVRHRIGVGVDQRHLDVVAFMDHHHRRRHRAVERHGLKFGAGVVDDDFLFLDRQFELDDLGTFLGRLFVRMHKGRRDQFDGLPRQLEIVGGQRRGGGDKGGDGSAQQCGTAGDHDTILSVSASEIRVPLMRLVQQALFAQKQPSPGMPNCFAVCRRTTKRAVMLLHMAE